ncbi:MAG TPA: DUF4382 domain-containing protein [Steroidobacteraceae bacterium]
MNQRLPIAFLAAICGLSGLLAACSTRTEVSLTGNTPAQYSHVWMTVQEVWLNSSATAGPEDGGWAKFPLSSPSTVDLVAQNGGNLDSIASGLRIPAATYSQVRLIPVDASAALSASAQNAGALYNFEADYVDSKGVTQQVPLALLNPDKGIGIQTSIKVPVGNGSRSLTGASATTTGALPFGSTSGTVTSPFGSTTGTMTSNTTSTVNSTSSATSNTASNSFAVALDGGSDLVPFSFATGGSAILLSAHGAAYDLAQAGAISGQLTLINIPNYSSGLRVSAQTLNADGTRHIIACATAVQSDGSFLLYPLATNSSATSPLTYDVVIHGPGIATIVVKGVQVPRASSSTATGTTTSTTSTTGTSSTPYTTGNTTTGTSSTSSTTTNPNVNPVSIGTLTPRADPDSYTANIATAPGAPLPAGALVNFYQTLGGKGEAPYVIESSPIDPFNQVLFNTQTLSSATVDSGTWSTNGAVIIVSASPAEGDGTYKVAAVAPGYSDGALDPKDSVSKPSSGTATVVVPTLKLGAGATAGSLAANVIATAPGKYDQGELLLSHDGALVAAASLDAVLTQGTGGVVKMANLPSGTPNALYYATVLAWKSTDSGSSVQRQWYPQAIDMRTSTSASITLPVN